jgi:hypothetical protein
VIHTDPVQSAAWPMYWYTYHAFDDFRSQYKSKFGKNAYVGPYMQSRWKIGADVTKEQRDDGMEKMEVFRRWFAENVMDTARESMEEAVLIMPFGSATPQYRDVTHG